MQILMFRALVAALLWLPIACTATSREGPAIVTERDGQPCFALNEQPMSSLNAVMVYDQSTRPPTYVWVADIDPDQARKLLAGCVVYGQIFPNQKAGHLPPRALRIGQVYKVYLMAEPSDPTDPTHSYSAQFCLVAQQGGAKPGVHQIVRNKRAAASWGGGWGDEICGLQQPEKP